jgi:membrane-associated HD superfamily phosphohydrolase
MPLACDCFGCVQANLFFDEEATRAARDKAEESVEPVM